MPWFEEVLASEKHEGELLILKSIKVFEILLLPDQYIVKTKSYLILISSLNCIIIDVHICIPFHVKL